MTKLNEKRDELAEELMRSIFRMEPWREPPDFDYCFKQGFDAAIAELMPQVQKLVGALSGIQSQYEDMSDNDIRDHWHSTAKQALTEWQEYVGEK